MSIIINGSKLRAYEYLGQLCDYAGWSEEEKDNLWQKFLNHSDLYDEFIFYLSHHEFQCSLCFRGYTLIDLYVWQMNHYNLIHDIGKNTDKCNKESMVLRAFFMMAEFMEDPISYEKKLTGRLHQDRL
ncbi:MAG: hypothetical protein IJZ44_07490 [Lachnospiraceae bacterium]|nr:hypothetical protein [Lachnospiraceae bacterium]